jgi:hypothetical protein
LCSKIKTISHFCGISQGLSLRRLSG